LKKPHYSKKVPIYKGLFLKEKNWIGSMRNNSKRYTSSKVFEIQPLRKRF